MRRTEPEPSILTVHVNGARTDRCTARECHDADPVGPARQNADPPTNRRGKSEALGHDAAERIARLAIDDANLEVAVDLGRRLDARSAELHPRVAARETPRFEPFRE